MTLRVASVDYLNARPLVWGLERGPGAGRLALERLVPARLAERTAAGEVDIGLLPVIELGRMPQLEIVPGLSIASRGPAGSVLLVSRRPPDRVRRVALDPESRTSNALCRVLFAEVWHATPEFVTGGPDLEDALAEADAVVRIGDKALFEPRPAGLETHDLGQVWTARTGLPFVFAVWAARPGVVDREVYELLHRSRREGSRALETIAATYVWRGRSYPDLARRYLAENIVYRLGSAELAGLEAFLAAAAAIGLIERKPPLTLALRRRTACDEAAARSGGVQ